MSKWGCRCPNYVNGRCIGEGGCEMAEGMVRAGSELSKVLIMLRKVEPMPGGSYDFSYGVEHTVKRISEEVKDMKAKALAKKRRKQT